MTPTLLGRWQTRLFLLGTVGAAVTLLYMYRFDAFETSTSFGVYDLEVDNVSR